MMKRMTMKISTLMGLVAMVALNFGAVDLIDRINYDDLTLTPRWREFGLLALCGVWPMANLLILVSALSRGRRGRGSTWFLAVGATIAVVLLLVSAIIPRGLIYQVNQILNAIDRSYACFDILGRPRWFGWASFVAILLLPQLVPALLAAWSVGLRSSGLVKSKSCRIEPGSR